MLGTVHVLERGAGQVTHPPIALQFVLAFVVELDVSADDEVCASDDETTATVADLTARLVKKSPAQKHEVSSLPVGFTRSLG